MKNKLLIALLSLTAAVMAAEAPKRIWIDPVIMENEYVKIIVDRGRGGVVGSLTDKSRNTEMVQEVFRKGKWSGGLSEDRFGGGNYYTGPLIWMAHHGELKREGDTQILELTGIPGKDDTPNFGKKLIKIYKLRDGDSYYTCEWKIQNIRNRELSIVPWVHNMPKRAHSVFPEPDGIHMVGGGHDLFQDPVRNWMGAYDPQTGGLMFFCPEYNHLEKVYYCFWNGFHTLEWVYRSALLKPGEIWSSTYTAGSTRSEYMPVAMIPEAVCSIKREADALIVSLSPCTKVEKVTATAVLPDGKVIGQGTADWIPGKPVSFSIPKKNLPAGKTEITVKLSAPKKGFPLKMFEKYGNELVFDLDGAMKLDPQRITPTKWPPPPLPYRQVTGRDLPAVTLPTQSSCGLSEVSMFTKIFEPDRLGKDPKPVKLNHTAVRNGMFHWQFVLSNPTKQKINFNIDAKSLVIRCGKAELPVTLRQVGYIRTKWPSQFKMDRPVGNWPDPILPVGKYITVKPGHNLPLYVTVKIPADAVPGTYQGAVRLSGKGGKNELPLNLTVSPVTLPDEPLITTFAGCRWLFQHVLDEVHYKGTRNEFHDLCLEQYYAHRITPRDANVPWDGKMGEKLQNRLHELKKLHVTSVSVPARIIKNPKKAPIAVQMLKNAGLYEKAYHYTIDEAPQHRFGEIVEIVTEIRKAAPGFRILGTIYDPDVSQLYGYVNIWCRGAIQEEPWMEARRKQGDVFVSSNLRNIDVDNEGHEVLNCLLLLKKLNWSGYLYWNMVSGHNHDNPWKEISSSGRNGEGHLIYPHSSGPVLTVRFEAIGRSMEYFELLALLQKADPAAYQALQSRLSVNSSDDAEQLYADIVKALEKK